ncbi:MAG: helix-turn-helix domain-containing protein [Ferruginibacter sp.]
MSSTDTSNHYFWLASRFVNQTGQSVFLTGKAGTGKTTFLKYIKENTFKKTVIVAPTGVAAINAGGVTMHSFFQLPFGPFIPAQNGWNGNSSANSLIKNIRFNAEKRELLKELELLIIDEVSMVRADMLDAVDIILRHFRDQHQLPFGGVQVLFIGDLFQLPPVVNNSEWEMLKPYYKSPFFFDAQVLMQSQPVCIELKKIYRQNEASFISILNKIRNNQLDYDDLQLLHQYYKPGFEAPEDEHYITLTSHNRNADIINQNKLNSLDEKLFEFRAELTGDFNEKAIPAEMLLQLKVGAQIMFIKNDKGESRRFYNGRIAAISRIESDEIYVVFPDAGNEILLEKEVWKNIRYSYNKETDEMEEEELGSFTQYPIRLAWAITIHKSQGLTFEKAIVDAGASFAPGQVYVALSRLTSLAGLVLYSRIYAHSIKTDERILTFSENEMKEELLEAELEKEQQYFIGRSLVKTFNWTKLDDAIRFFYDEFEHRVIPDKFAAIEWAKKLMESIGQQKMVAQKFDRQLEQILQSGNGDYTQLEERVKAAVDYFIRPLDESIKAVNYHLKEYKPKQRTKKYIKELADLLLLLERKKQQLQQSLVIAEGLLEKADPGELLQKIHDSKNKNAEKENALAIAAKPKKGETKKISLEMFREGKRIDEIAKLRGMVMVTIEGHLAEFIKTGEIEILDLLSKEKLDVINKIIEDTGAAASSVYKEKLGQQYSYSDIKAVMNWREKEQLQQS